MDIIHLIQQAHKSNASDIHCTVGEEVRLRIHGRLVPMNEAIFEYDIYAFLQTMRYEKVISEKREMDFAFTHPSGIRSRIHLFYQKSLPSLVIRLFPTNIPSTHELGIPNVVLQLTNRKSGLLLVTGPTGSGKSTTIASLLHHLNHTKSLHIITLEDPIEYIHRSDKSKVSQREVGVDTDSFAQGVRAALRQDPDVMMIGELRDEESIHAAVRAAEAGRLVLGTLHTCRAMLAIQRVIDVFEEGKQNLIKSQLAASLVGVVSQRLIMNESSNGRIAQFEILVNTPAIANLIRLSQVHQIESLMQTGAMYGMQTFKEELEQNV